MSEPVCLSLLDAMHTLTDPRQRRGVRHPYASLLGLTLLGLLCRQSDFTSIARWARQHWGRLRGLLGWLRTLLDPAVPLTAAVDGKTSRQSHDADGDPIHVLNVFAHDLKVCLA